MPVLFHDVRLPDNIERGAHGGPSFKTTVIATSSGVEFRNIDWAKSRAVWDCGYGIATLDDLATVQAFFFARRGRAYGFRFKDWSDYLSNPTLGVAGFEAIGTGDGANRVFQLIKTYESSGPLPFVRVITRPVVGTLVVKVSGVTNANWTLDATTGIVTFTPGNAPAAAAPVTASFEFDIPVRFDSDTFDLTVEVLNAGEIPNLPIMEIRDGTAAPVLTGETMILLNTLTANNSATLDDITSLTAFYDSYFIEFANVIPATNATKLLVQISENLGVAFQTTGYIDNSANTDGVYMTGGSAGIDNTALLGMSGFCYLHNVNSAAKKAFVGRTAYPAAAVLTTSNIFGYYNTDANVLNGLRFKMVAGNITSGRIRIYGLR